MERNFSGSAGLLARTRDDSMLAADFRGPYRIRTVEKPRPKLEHPRDAIVRVTRTCICGSDIHLYRGLVPDTRVGTTFGHEFCGFVEDLGSDVENLKVGDHVLVPFNIACGQCHFCKQGLVGNCHEVNAQATAVGGIFGYSHTAAGTRADRLNMFASHMQTSAQL
jgi:threonine dehydrogenase-like Zn-dependent dehydrogenase